MRTVVLTPFSIDQTDHRRILYIRYRSTVDGVWEKTGFWRFQLPVDEENIFTRAYLELRANRVYAQPNMFIKPSYGVFY